MEYSKWFTGLAVVITASCIQAHADTSATHLADATRMTPYARDIFMSRQPLITNRDVISASCSGLKDLVVMGCNANSRIFILEATEPELSGLTESTGAHEMLHAAYARLSATERQRVNKLLDTAYRSLDDKDITDRIEKYRNSGEDVLNELHSVLGTEVATLPPELENYYAKYFSLRARVVSFHSYFQQGIESRHSSVVSYDQTLDKLKVDIESRHAMLDIQAKQLDQAKLTVEALRKTNQIGQYNNAVAKFNALAHAYNDGAKEVNDLADRYKQVEKQRNGTAAEGNRLAASVGAQN